MITVYSTTGCVGCTATVQYLDKLELDYEVKKVPPTEIPEHLGHYRQLPIVDTDTLNWSGFRPDLISALAMQSE